MKLIGCAVLLLLLAQVSHAKTGKINRIYGEVLLTEVAMDTPKIWHREEIDAPTPLVNYPIELAKARIQGCTVLSFDITEDGTTENVGVVSSIPNKHLGKYTKKEIKGWRWEQLEPQQSAMSEKRILRFDYCLGLESAEQSLAQCQQQAQLNCG
ncbi:energy transducer TonB [uncultured Shewanella sp.]|uniref:energy transducer TonB n=1 Tax=uncultured Shewanella sp. TaxID=173975 RepID=UPI0026126C66|nr:energy transducer TonB [uncultured Shewanella sp.]